MGLRWCWNLWNQSAAPTPRLTAPGAVPPYGQRQGENGHCVPPALPTVGRLPTSFTGTPPPKKQEEFDSGEKVNSSRPPAFSLFPPRKLSKPLTGTVAGVKRLPGNKSLGSPFLTWRSKGDETTARSPK